jgi:hypothetical protein
MIPGSYAEGLRFEYRQFGYPDQGNPLKSTGSMRTALFNTLELCILTTECICVFRMVLTINSDCFPKQH